MLMCLAWNGSACGKLWNNIPQSWAARLRHNPRCAVFSWQNTAVSLAADPEPIVAALQIVMRKRSVNEDAQGWWDRSELGS
jgi:hypothetical protein